MAEFFFVGIKGSGMAALACILKSLGHEVSGSDIDKHLFTEAQLHELNIPIYPFNTIPKEHSTVIIGNAFKDDFEDVKRIKERNDCVTYRYHEYLGLLMNEKTSIGISGSHGKTTSTKMMTSIMQGYQPTGFLIGDGHGHLSQQDKYFIVEADEYRKFFHSYHPKFALITNVDYDHVDFFKTEDDYRLAYEDYTRNIKEAVFIFGDDPLVKSLNIHCKAYTYGLNKDNDVVGTILYEDKDKTELQISYCGMDKGIITLPFSGRHLVWNAIGCIAIAITEGVDMQSMQKGISHFENAARRFVVEEIGENIYIDDYAHHPTEVSVTIDAARLKYPNKKLVAIFKPHRVSRLYHFVDDFAKALKKADDVFLVGFNAIDDQEEGYDITIDYLKDRIEKAQVIEENETGAQILKKLEPAVYLFMSSKDIYILSDLLKRYQKH